MAFDKNEVRQFPTMKDFLGEKVMDDRIYGYLQTHSYLTDEQIRYCWKRDMSAKKIKMDLEKTKHEDNESKVPSEDTIRKILKLLVYTNLINEERVGNKQAYILHDLRVGEYVFIKTRTLEYLMNCSNSNVVKVYAYLKKKQELHKRYGHNEQYKFSEDQLLRILGYNVDHEANHKMVFDILTCLQNNGLIKIHKYFVNVWGNQKVYYWFLDEVNDDYTCPLKKRRKDDNDFMMVPVPQDNIAESDKNVKSLEEFMNSEF